MRTISRHGGEDGRTALESALILFFIAILLVAGLDRFTRSVRAIKESAMTVELSNLRSAVNFYAMINMRLPASLKVLLVEKAVLPAGKIEGAEYDVIIIGKYVESMTVDSEGYPLDPFGNRYLYDPGTGSVHPGTEGYEKW